VTVNRPAAPSRKTNSFTISWGLVSIPVGMYSGTEDFGIKRNRFTAEGHEVGMKNYDKETGADVEYGDIVMRYRLEDGTTVELSNEEIEAVVQPIKGVATVEAFVPLAHLVAGTYVPDSLAQVRPADRKNGTKTVADPAAQKAFTLFMRAMQEEGVFALVDVVLSGKPRKAAILPDGRMFTLKFDQEIRLDRPMPAVDVTDAELQMGRQLISVLRTEEPPALADESTEKVHAYAVAKAAAGDAFEAPKPEEAPVASDDLMAALQASLATTAA